MLRQPFQIYKTIFSQRDGVIIISNRHLNPMPHPQLPQHGAPRVILNILVCFREKEGMKIKHRALLKSKVNKTIVN